MGLFSIFKGKKPATADAGPAAFPDSRLMRGEPSRMDDAERERQREIARATAAKIDAIEEELTSMIFEGEQEWGADRLKARLPAGQDLADTELMPDGLLPPPAEADHAPLADEAAIMWANGEAALAEQMLRSGLGEERQLWWMLFDLYQITGKQDEFDSLAIDYASRFETSPPAWNPPSQPQAAGVAPTVAFSGRLDESSAPQIDRLAALGPEVPALRLEFGRVQDVTPEGCALLTRALAGLRKRALELTLSGASDFAELLRSTLQVGQRTTPQESWLLLLELLLLLDREKEFEETAMDYCVTYEVSPPSFEHPARVATATPARAAPATDRFVLPATITGTPAELFDAIDLYVSQYQPAVLDGARLARIDFTAASALLERLRPLAAEHSIELRDVNHLVAALWRLLGSADVLRLFAHKY